MARKTKKPSKEELLKLLTKHRSIITVANHYSVDESSVRRWRDSYGISRALKDTRNSSTKEKLKINKSDLENAVYDRLLNGIVHVDTFSKEFEIPTLDVYAAIHSIEKSGIIVEKSGSGFYVNRSGVPMDLVYDYSKKKKKFAVIGDTHLNSKEQQLTNLKAFYKICKKEGITDIYHAGDIIAGNKIYRGQAYETFFQGADDQAKYCIDEYPHEKGITTHFIIGNHDYSYFKDSGIDIGKMIGKDRKDMKYLGQMSAVIDFGGGTRMKLLHPDGGCSYAKSYKPQKIVEGFAPENKPDILVLGHYHTSGYFTFRGVHVFMSGCFEGQTPYLQRKGLEPEVGGWIVDVNIDEDSNSINRIKPEWVSFKHMHKDY